MKLGGGRETFMFSEASIVQEMKSSSGRDTHTPIKSLKEWWMRYNCALGRELCPRV